MTPSMETWAPTMIFRTGHSPCTRLDPRNTGKERRVLLAPSSERGRPEAQTRHYLARVHRRMEPPHRGKLQIQDGDRRQETQQPRVDSDRTQDLARQEDV